MEQKTIFATSILKPNMIRQHTIMYCQGIPVYSPQALFSHQLSQVMINRQVVSMVRRTLLLAPDC